MRNCDVIIPCYNYARFLRTCVDSVLRQENCSVRALILNDCSTDESLEVARALAEEDARITLIHHEKNKGHIATYNEGIEWVSADYMLLLSADDLLAPGALSRAIGIMEERQDVAFVYGRAIKFSDDREAVVPRDFVGARQTIWKGLDFIREVCSKPECPVPTATAVVRTSAQKRVGGYRPELPHTGDFEMWLRLAANGDVGAIDGIQAFTRVHGTNMRNAYLANRMVGDYRQRYEALRLFFASEWARPPVIQNLSTVAYRSLAEEIAWDASSVFEEGAVQDAAILRDLARAIHPDIARRPLWWKLSLKRLLGPRAWRSLAPAVEGVRLLLSRERAASMPQPSVRLMNGIDTNRLQSSPTEKKSNFPAH